MKTVPTRVLLMMAIAAAAAAESAPARTAPPPAPFAQWLTERAVADHPALESAEIAAEVDGACITIAASAKDEIGEPCDGEEIRPLRDGGVEVGMPTPGDPAFDVTLPLHDRKGNTIATLGLDVSPRGMDRGKAAALAHRVLAEMESRLPSREKLFAPAP